MARPGEGYEVRRRGNTVKLDLMYPGINDNPTHVEVDMCHVRATDSIRISFDFPRDGWKIEQASTFSWELGDEVCDPDWQEVAFIKAWAREKPDQPGSE